MDRLLDCCCCLPVWLLWFGPLALLLTGCVWVGRRKHTQE